MKASTHRARHKEALRTLILDAARDIFVREGYENFSMRKLGRNIGYSPGSIYLHFKDKAELFRCLVDESFAHLLKALRRQGNGEKRDPLTLLKKGLRTYVEFGLRHPNHYRLAFLSRPPVTKGSDKPHPAFYVMHDIVRECVAEKYFRDVDVDTASQALWAAVHGVTSLLIVRPSFPWVAKDKLVERVIESAVDSLVANSEHAAEAGGQDAEYIRGD